MTASSVPAGQTYLQNHVNFTSILPVVWLACRDSPESVQSLHVARKRFHFILE